ncbi:MAG TPA: hypothetical protein VJO53_03995 [Candidatus Acidoferrales bacterium]|nr:hypothetical protein [Candidatus Acidoferrales bacterium]
MPVSSTKRAWIAVAILVGVAAAGVGVYFYRMQRPLAGPSAGAAPDLLSLFPADAPAIAFVDVAALRKLQGSELAEMLGLAGADPKEDRDYQKFVRDTGFDYTRDLDQAAIAYWPASLMNPNSGFGENRVLAIADGRFDQMRIEAYALRTGKQVARGARQLYEIPGNPPVAFEFRSATRIALASGTDAGNLIGATYPTARDAATQARIDRVAGAPIFAVARTDNLPPSFYDNFRNAPQLANLARSVRGLTLAGQPQGESIAIALDGECDSMKSALELATLLDGFRMVGSMALADPKTLRQMTKPQAAFLTALVNQVKVSHQDRWVRLTLDITPEMLAPGKSTHAGLR